MILSNYVNKNEFLLLKLLYFCVFYNQYSKLSIKLNK